MFIIFIIRVMLYIVVALRDFEINTSSAIDNLLHKNDALNRLLLFI